MNTTIAGRGVAHISRDVFHETRKAKKWTNRKLGMQKLADVFFEHNVAVSKHATEGKFENIIQLKNRRDLPAFQHSQHSDPC